MTEPSPPNDAADDPWSEGGLDRVSRYVTGASLVLAGLAFVFGGLWVGFGALVGALFGCANWQAAQWLCRRLLRAHERGQMLWLSLLTFKMAAALGVVWAILSTGWVDVAGFAIGMSGLVVGLVAGAIHTALLDTEAR